MSEFDPFGCQVYYRNDYQTTAAEETIPVHNPATEEVVGEIADCGETDVTTILEQAADAQTEWGQLPPTTRASYLHDVADAIESNGIEDVAELMTREHGKPYPESVGELANVSSIFRYYAELVRDDDGTMPGSTSPESFQFARYFPYGVSVHIAPTNYPILILCWTVAASIAAGNTAVVKPSEVTPLSTLRFMRNFDVLPDGVVSCITGRGETAQALLRSEETDVAAFTGSVEVGTKVHQTCAEQLMPCVIEAGGNDPMIVSEHAPLDVAIPGATTSAFHLSGQVCTASERFYVHESVHDEFVAGLADMAEALRIGDGLEESEIGPLVSESARDRVKRLVDDAVEAGATVVCGGQIPPEQETGWFYEPTVLTDVTPEMDIVQEEIFGPVAPVVEISSFEEGLSHANHPTYGLGASVFTTDLEEAMCAYESIEAGMVWINNPMIDNEAIPFGGWKRSGVGRELGRPGLDTFRQTKMGVLDWNPKIYDWWYPYPDEWFYNTDGRRL